MGEQLQCSQCGKPAVKAVQAIPLCVSCFYTLQVADTLARRLAAIGMNYAADQMETITGMRGYGVRMQVPEIPKGPTILHNIKVDRSVIGSVNTGSIEKVDVSISYLKAGGNEQLSAALQSLTEAIAVAPELGIAPKSELLDQVAFLSEQAAVAAKDRRPGMIRAALEALTAGATVVSSVEEAWTAAEPFLRSLFGIS